MSEPITLMRPLYVIEYPSALCAQTDPELFYPDKGGSTKAAKEICHRCVHESECLEDALARDERYGVYGGKSERERKRISNARKTTALA